MKYKQRWLLTAIFAAILLAITGYLPTFKDRNVSTFTYEAGNSRSALLAKRNHHKNHVENERAQWRPLKNNSNLAVRYRIVRSADNLDKAVDSEIIPKRGEPTKIFARSEDMAPLKLTCQEYTKQAQFIKSFKQDPRMTVKKCHVHCMSTNSTFMGLANGDSCICSDQHGATYVQKDSECNVTCMGSSSTLCGGKDRIQYYRIAALDGGRYWSSWSRHIPSRHGDIWTRYRNCPLNVSSSTHCEAQLQRDFYNVMDETLQNHWIGCFTDSSFQELSTPFIKSVRNAFSEDLDGQSQCVEVCRMSQLQDVYYAVFVNGKCLCTSSLGWSQMTESCPRAIGALVYSLQPITDDAVILRFEARHTERQIAVLAHYRGGSTLTSTVFSAQRGSLSAFELDKVLGSRWPGVDVHGLEQERSHVFLNKVLPSWLDCHSLDLPGIFYRVFYADREFYIGLEPVLKCLEATRYRRIAKLCGPFLREQCLMATVVISKTVRILHAKEIKRAVLENPQVDFVHSVRDPRAMHASRASFSSFYTEQVVRRLRDSCWELLQLYKALEAGNQPANIYIIHYEDLATDLLKATANIYRRMNLTFTEEIGEKLSQLTGSKVKRSSAFDIVQKDPKKRISSWMNNRKWHGYIQEADNSGECSLLFAYYRRYYKPLAVLLRE